MSTASAAAAQNFLPNPRFHIVSSSRSLPNLPRPRFPKLPLRSSRLRLVALPHGAASQRTSCGPGRRWRVHVFESGLGEAVRRDGPDRVDLDAFLSVVEVLCIAPCVVFSICCAVNSAVSGSQRLFQVSLGNKFFVWQVVFLVAAVVVSSIIRRRQWQRIYWDSYKRGNSSVNVIERIEKLEEDLKSSATIVRVLSRQLEKLGIRFRVTRKALRGPITETAALAQKNSEATRALAMQEDILEKELGEIQKVLLAMQEQQQKQLDLILAISKSGKSRERRRDSIPEPPVIEARSHGPVKEVAAEENEAARLEGQKGSGNNKV